MRVDQITMLNGISWYRTPAATLKTGRHRDANPRESFSRGSSAHGVSRKSPKPGNQTNQLISRLALVQNRKHKSSGPCNEKC